MLDPEQRINQVHTQKRPEGFEAFGQEFAGSLNQEQVITIRHAVQEYLSVIEKDIEKSQGGYEPCSRDATTSENLTFLYGIAMSCSAILFSISDLSNTYGCDL